MNVLLVFVVHIGCFQLTNKFVKWYVVKCVIMTLIVTLSIGLSSRHTLRAPVTCNSFTIFHLPLHLTFNIEQIFI